MDDIATISVGRTAMSTTADRIAALDIIDRPPMPCLVELDDAYDIDEWDTWILLALEMDIASIAGAESGPHAVALSDLTILLGPEHDPFGMVEHALRVKLARRVGSLHVPPYAYPKGAPHSHGDRIGLSLLLNLHRYIARTDRLCERVCLKLQPGEVAEWHQVPMFEPSDMAWGLTAGEKTMFFCTIPDTHPAWTLVPALAGIRPDQSLEALAACLDAA